MWFSAIEARHLLKAWLLVSLAFAIAMTGFRLNAVFLAAVVFSAITAGIGFLGHEMMHKFAAQHYGCRAEFRANSLMLGLMLIISFSGFIFAAPGGVYILNRISKRQNGIISLAGPLTNIILGIAFAAIAFILPEFLVPLAGYGMRINFWLGFFNLLPLPGIDGSKILAWNWKAYAAMLAISLFCTFVV